MTEFRVDPHDGNAYRIVGPANGKYVTICDVDGGHEVSLRTDEWMKWELAAPATREEFIAEALAACEAAKLQALMRPNDLVSTIEFLITAIQNLIKALDSQ